MSNTMNFDESFYLSQNPDVAAAISRGIFTSGAQHYQLNGRFEGRNPNAFFNTSFYLGQYPDVAKAGINPLTHFLTSGAAEGRFANATEKGAIDLNNNGGADDFNDAAYRTAYSDVDAAIKAGTFKNAYQHFVQFGQFEGRVGTLANGTTITGPFSNTGTLPNAGSTITLTANVDGPNAVAPAANTLGTSGNDTYIATDATLQSSDSINGGAGTDALNLRIVTGGTVIAPSLQSVENITVTNISGTATGGLNLASATGVTNLTESGSTANSTSIYTNVAATTALGLDAAKGAEIISINGAGSRTGTADVLGLTVANGTGAANAYNQLSIGTVAGGVVTADNTFEVLRVATSGAASYVNVLNGGTNVNTVTVTGNAAAATSGATAGYAINLTEAGNFANVKTIDASGLTGTGGINIATTLAQDVTFTGSALNDRLVVTAGVANLTSADKLAFGAGTDTLAFGTDTAETGYTAAQISAINAATGLERIEFTAANFTALKANDFTAVNAFEISGGGTSNVVLTGVESNDSFAFSTSHTGSITFTGAAVAQTANLIETGGVTLTGAAAGGNAVAFNGNITTLTVNSVGATANSIIGGTGTAGTNGANPGDAGGNGGVGGTAIANGTAVQTLTITGSQNLTIGGGAGGAAGTGNGAANGNVGAAGVGFSGAISVDATQFTGKLAINGSTGDDIIKVGVASTGDSTLTHNTITGGAGADTITLNTGIDWVDYRTGGTGNSVAGTIDTVNAFTAGQDKFLVNVAVTGVNTTLNTAGTGALATDLTTALQNGFGGTNNAAYVTINGGTDAGTYLVVNTDGGVGYQSATDLAVKLVGLTGTLSATDFTNTFTA